MKHVRGDYSACEKHRNMAVEYLVKVVIQWSSVPLAGFLNAVSCVQPTGTGPDI